MRRLFPCLVVLVLAGCTCSSGPSPRSSGSSPSSSATHTEAPRPTSAADEAQDIAGGLAWHVEEPLVSRTPTSSVRAAEYIVRDHPEAELAVFHFGEGQGGSVDDNVGRWLGQFTQPDGRDTADVATVEHREYGGLPTTYVDTTGVFSGMRGEAATEGAGGQRMLGAIVEGPSGLVFFKLIGPVQAVTDAEDAFVHLLESIHPVG
jgi:hypothetical protein